jgi:hypothetical protein
VGLGGLIGLAYKEDIGEPGGDAGAALDEVEPAYGILAD